jgi:hypothetical protein
MGKGKRNVGREILEGLREIKSGRHGRVVNLPSVEHSRKDWPLTRTFRNIAWCIDTNTTGLGARPASALRRSSHAALDR